MEEPQPRDSQNRIIKPSDYRYTTAGFAEGAVHGESGAYMPNGVWGWNPRWGPAAARDGGQGPKPP